MVKWMISLSFNCPVSHSHNNQQQQQRLSTNWTFEFLLKSKHLSRVFVFRIHSRIISYYVIECVRPVHAFNWSIKTTTISAKCSVNNASRLFTHSVEQITEFRFYDVRKCSTLRLSVSIDWFELIRSKRLVTGEWERERNTAQYKQYSWPLLLMVSAKI